ncbi:cytochrome b5-like heme/steroid binding domain-containing protein [Aspergillus ruber CBS 135680]|uniref:Cytochrome b5 heme-binding domain-containing protein n=1 Tax=Aspergillus ruber (strain CBS 135680) TaxID=1388766 RepID=A0A017SMV2_ASPRC|nr:uncharacterized protein EURHEDRAFT_449490 [Aspergillus ruber CBS 135680]EYE97954.1 hypothetical protein EURHEDRAFT_449490 [Aspergillus ruber CBS 135680]
MGWVGVATLIATACYVFYRFPPHTWPSEPASTPPEPIPEAPPRNNARTTDKAKPPVIPKIESAVIENEEENAEEQSTPKASASAPVLEVPVLDLDDSAAEDRSAKSTASSNHNDSSLHHNSSTDTVARQAATMPPRPLPPTPSPSSSPSQADSSSLMPPPPLPRNRATGQQTQSSKSQFLSPGPVPGRKPPRLNSNSLAPPPSAASSQRGPQRLAPPTNSLAPPAQASLKLPSSANNASKRAILEPGFSPLDWAALTTNPKANLRGENLPPHLIRVTPSMLKIQNGRKGRDAWTSYQGKVFNIQPYVPFHPGGKGELLRGAGKDSAKLFLEVHPWVNWDAILGECLVGILVSENEGENALDAMD